MTNLNEVIFDVETKKLFEDIDGRDPGNLGVSIVSAYIRTLDENMKEVSGEMKSYWEGDFPSLWEVFQKADRIIGFNTLGFDVPALQPYASFPILRLPHFDILEKFKSMAGRRISLNSLAKDTLGTAKIDSGINAVAYWESGDPESLKKLQKYCEADVAITRDVYDFGLREGKLKFSDKWNTPREIIVDFSYPKEEKEKSAQDSLF